MTFQFYSDPGHGWLRVDLASAKAVGLEPSNFSTCSYQQGPWLYLEEDCDASIFVKAYMDKHNRPPVIKQHVSERESVIRNYPRIAA
jgi:hypothetical protein